MEDNIRSVVARANQMCRENGCKVPIQHYTYRNAVDLSIQRCMACTLEKMVFAELNHPPQHTA